MRPTRHDLSNCPNECGEKILWTRTEYGEKLAVDATPHPDGNQAVRKDGIGVWRSRSLTSPGALRPAQFESVYMPHVATCASKAPVQPAITGLMLTVPADNVVGLGPRPSRRRRRARR